MPVLALGVLSKSGDANCIGRCDSGVHAQCHDRVGDLFVFVDEFEGVVCHPLELQGLVEPAFTN